MNSLTHRQDAKTPTRLEDQCLDDPAARLSLPALRVYKQDRRSRVWLVEDARRQRWVVKRFEHPALKQRITAKLGHHPAQREATWHARLIAADLPVVPIVGVGADVQGRQWLVTPWVGDDLVEWIKDGRAHHPAARHGVTRQLGELAGRLMRMRVFCRDFKARNIVIDAAGKVWLIDAGGCRGGKGTPLLAIALRMLKLMHRTAADAAKQAGQPEPSRADRLRFYRAMLTAWPSLPDGLQHLPRSGEFGGR